MYSIQFGQDTIPYTIKWSERRKTVSISVDANGVYVIAPTQTTAKSKNLFIKRLHGFENNYLISMK